MIKEKVKYIYKEEFLTNVDNANLKEIFNKKLFDYILNQEKIGDNLNE